MEILRYPPLDVRVYWCKIFQTYSKVLSKIHKILFVLLADAWYLFNSSKCWWLFVREKKNMFCRVFFLLRQLMLLLFIIIIVMLLFFFITCTYSWISRIYYILWFLIFHHFIIKVYFKLITLPTLDNFKLFIILLHLYLYFSISLIFACF